MTPEEVVQRFSDCMREGRYGEAARCFSDAHLTLIGTEAEEIFAPPYRPTIDSLMADNPEMTWLEAHDEVSAFESFAGGWDPPDPDLAGIRSLEELRALAPHDVGARWLEASDPGAHHRAAIDELIELHPEFRSQLVRQRDDGARMWNVEVLGAVAKPHTAYVVWREPGGGTTEMGQVVLPYVAVLQKAGNSWKLAADPRPHAGPMAYHLVAAVETDDGETVHLSSNDEDNPFGGNDPF
jgi:hypothetical protein